MRKLCRINILANFLKPKLQARGNIALRFINYVQGQSPEPKSREYFYYIDHQGMLFLDDAKMKNFTSCFKEKKFLAFFFSRLSVNDTGRYEEEFPFYSPCGREKNYIRCDDLPVVFTHIIQDKSDREAIDYLTYGYAGDSLKVRFEPQSICMLPQSGRIYHPGPEAVGGVGLIRSSLAIVLSQKFEYRDAENTDEMPVYFQWKNKRHLLTNNILEKLESSFTKGMLHK